MIRTTSVLIAVAFTSTYAFGDQQVTPNINKSTEFDGVYHSPSAKHAPVAFRSVYQMEIVVETGQPDTQLVYANGTVVSNDGLVLSVMSVPGVDVTITSASVLFLDGRSATAQLVAQVSAYGVAVFRVQHPELRPLPISTTPFVGNRRATWHTVFREGRKTFLYRRPLRLHESGFQNNDELCRLIDHDSSSLTAERSGSAIIALNGTLLAVMGRQKHWNVTPKNGSPQTKTAWAVPASAIRKILATIDPPKQKTIK